MYLNTEDISRHTEFHRLIFPVEPKLSQACNGPTKGGEGSCEPEQGETTILGSNYRTTVDDAVFVTVATGMTK